MPTPKQEHQKYISFHVTRKRPVAHVLYYPRNEEQAEAYKSLAPDDPKTVGEKKKQALEQLGVLFTVYNEDGEELSSPDFRHRRPVVWIRSGWPDEHPRATHQYLYCPMEDEWTEDMKEALRVIRPQVNCITRRNFDNLRTLGQAQKLYEVDPSFKRRVKIE